MDSKKRCLPRTKEVRLFCFGIRFHHTKIELPEELAEQSLLSLHDVADFTEEINNDFKSIVRCMKSKLSKKDNWFVKVVESPPTFLYQFRNFHITCSEFCYSHLVQIRVRISQTVDDEYSECGAAMDHHLPFVPFFGDNNYVLHEYKKFPNAVADDISELEKIVDGSVDLCTWQ